MQKDSVEIVIPVYNEEALLEKNAVHLHDFMEKNCKIPWQITIFSNGSSDKTLSIGPELNKHYPEIVFKHIPQKGRGYALRQAWGSSNASIVGYMDADLSTDLEAFPKCLNAIISGEADVAIGNRLSKESVVERCFKRELTSRGWNLLIRLFFPFTSITDSQCGFKFVRTSLVKKLLPRIKDNKFFLDTEMLMIAENSGNKISQIPVSWVERKASKVKVIRTITDYVFRLAGLRLRLWTR